MLGSLGNRASLSLQISTDDDNIFQRDAASASPTTVQVTSCNPQVQISSLDIEEGSIAVVIFDVVVDLMRDKMEEEAAKFLCDELEQMATNAASDWLQTLDDGLAQYPPSVVDMLASEEALEVPDSVQLLDFQQEGTVAAMREWVNQVLQEAVGYVAKPVEDPVTGNTTLNANVLVRQHLLDDGGAYRVDFGGDGMPIFDGHDVLTETIIVLEGMDVFGLDTLTTLGALATVGNQTIQSELSMDYLRAELDVSIVIKPSTLSDSLIVDPTSSNVVQERVKIKFGIDNVRASASLTLAIDKDKLGALRLGSLLNTEMVQPCFLSTLFALEVGGLSVEVDDIQPPILEGFVSQGIDRVVSSSVDAAFLVYERTLLQAMPGLFHVTVRDFINRMVATQYLPELDRECPWTNTSASANGFIDFRDLLLPADEALAAGGSGLQPYGDLLQRLVSEIKENWLADNLDGSPKINGLIRTIIAQQSNSTDGALVLGDVFSSNSDFAIAGLQANAAIAFSDARIENLDSFGNPLKLLDPVSGKPNDLNTTVSIGVGSDDLRLATKLSLSLSDGAGLSMQNEVAISLDLGGARVMIELLVEVLEMPFFAVPLRDTLDVDCWIATIFPSSSSDAAGIELIYQQVDVESLFVNFTCVSCSSPDFDDLAYELYSPDRTGNVTDALLNLLNLLKESDYLKGLNAGISSMASKQCPHSPDYDPNASYRDLFKAGGAGFVIVEPDRDKRAHFFNIASAVVAVCLVVLYVTVRRFVARKYLAWKKSLSEDTLSQLRLKEESERDEETHLNMSTTSMYRSSQSLARRVRLGFPAALVLTIALQLCGHFAVLSTVGLSGQIAGEPFFVQDFLEFRFFEALRRAAGNGGREMALLAFVFTGIWPYLKLVASLALWFMPPDKLSVSRRGSILVWLDVFAKLSVVDIVTLLFAVGAFIVYFGGLDKSLQTDGESWTMKAIVQPGLGCYTIVMAQRILRITSRYMLECHQRIIDGATRETSERRLTTIATPSLSWEYDESESGLASSASELEKIESESTGTIHSDHSSRPEVAEDEQPNQPISLLTVFAGITVLLIGMIGTFLAPAISIDTKAVWGIIGSGRTYQEAVNGLPVFRVITEILMQSRVALDSVRDYVGLGFLLVLVVVVATAFPVLKAVTNFRDWNCRRRRKAEQSAAEGLLRRSSSSNLCTSLVRTVSSSLEYVKSKVRQWHYSWMVRNESVRNQYSSTTGMNLLPMYRLKAWQQMEVYLSAFVIASWQLGAVAAYTIHLYCYFMEMIYKSFENLGLVERSEAECFRLQVSAPSTVSIVCVGFFVLLASFLWQAAAHYKKIVADAKIDFLDDCSLH